MFRSGHEYMFSLFRVVFSFTLLFIIYLLISLFRIVVLLIYYANLHRIKIQIKHISV
jgi:hypothetical protein